MTKLSWKLEKHKNLFVNTNVLDLACHSGDSSFKIKSYGANTVVGVDIRNNLISLASQTNQDPTVKFICNDITDYDFLEPLVKNSTVITCFGAFYHLFDHFRFLTQILKPNINYCLIETLYGPETPNPEMFWGFENTDSDRNGWLTGLTVIPHGTPNLSWIIQSAQILGFDIDFVEKRYQDTDFSKVVDHNTNRRMVLRLYNTKTHHGKIPLSLDNIWEWNNDNLIQGSLE